MKAKKEHVVGKFEPNQYPLDPGLRLLEASAGTGKTFALSHLVLRLLTEGNHSINEILVVTFTEAAAAELKARISTRIEEALKGLEALDNGLREPFPDKVLEEWFEPIKQDKVIRYKWASLLLEALESIDRADITTIHGFCARTLRREALDSNAAINPILEDEKSALALEVIHAYWHNQVLALSPGHLKGLKQAGLNIEKLYNGLLKIDNDPSIAFNFDNSSLNTSLVVQLDDWVKESWFNFLLSWQQEGLQLEDSLCNQAEQWRAQGVKDTKPFSPKPTKNRYEILNNWIKSICQPNNSTDIEGRPSYYEVRKQKLLGNYFHPAAICETAQRCGEENPSLAKPGLQKAIAELWDGPVEKVWAHGLAWALKELDERRQQVGVVSYGGLLKALDPANTTSNNIKNNPSNKKLLMEKLRNRYQVILIDEFQDTDSLQWRLLKKAFGNSPNHLLLIVGDPKQAIYRFRGGDLNIYMEARSEVSRIDELLDNYRTTAPLMHRINQLMSTGLFHSELKVPALTPYVNREELLSCNNQNPLKVLTIDSNPALKENESKLLLSKSQLEEIIPTAVTNEVLELLKDKSNRLSPSDICILVNRHNQAASIRDGLAIASIPSRLVTQGDVLTSEAAQVLQRFLDCLARPTHSGSLRLVACSALIQWDLKTLKEAEDNGAIDELAVRFRNWSENLTKLGLLGCLAELLESRVLADLSEQGRMLVDLRQCAQLVQEVIHREGLDAISAARWLKRQRLNPIGAISDEREPHSDVEESAVNVVTVHRSKGLEYRVVICPYLWQVPPLPSGPLWRMSSSNNWVIALNSKWGKGKDCANESKQATLQEAERHCYVAITRAKDRLVLLWAQGAKQEGNPLTPLLFGPESVQYKAEELTIERMKQWVISNKTDIHIDSAQTVKINGSWHPANTQEELALGPVPKRRLDISWGRNSYTSLVNSEHNLYNQPLDPTLKEEQKDIDHKDTDTIISSASTAKKSLLENPWPEFSPLANFPRGAVAGDCLHRILERVNFGAPLNNLETTTTIEEELAKAGIDIQLLSSVQEGLSRVLSTPLGGPLGDLRLNQLNEDRRIHELNFDLPIAQKGNQIRSVDLANAFLKNPQARFGTNYINEVIALNISIRGFLTGSIDLVFTDQKNNSNARWWIADWKSNWIGDYDDKTQMVRCGPHHYDEKAMEGQMIRHHYPLQAHIYLVALHRFLKWRLPNYSPTKHLGGYLYVFLRGIPDAKAIAERSHIKTLPGLIIEKAPIERVIELDRVLQIGGK